MSGPKVIRTVTIDQLREGARVQLALVANAIRLWQRATAGTDECTSSRLARWTTEQDRIGASLQADRFNDVATRSQALAAAIRQDIQCIHEEQDARNARFRVQERSLRQTANAILERCRRVGLVIQKDDEDKLEAAGSSRAFDVQEIASIASKWLEKVSGFDHRRKTDTQESLARSLSDPSGEFSAGELLRRLEAEFADPRINTAEKQIAELARLGEQQAAEQFGQRLSTIVSSEPGSNTIAPGLALDSLGLEMLSAVKRARERTELVRELAAEVAAATATSDLTACHQAILEAERALQTGDLERGRAHIDRTREIRETRQRARAANAARQTILSGLKKLGYEVHEGMLTAWAEKKRLSIRHPNRPGVALELAGAGDAGRMQTRMVAVDGAARDSRSDKLVEEEWCGELKSLREAIANAGGTVEIERALAAGVQPLKVIPDEWHNPDEWQNVATPVHKPRERGRI